MSRVGLFLNATPLPGLTEHDRIIDTLIAAVDEAERLGYHDVWVSEHHFIDFGVCSNALTLAGFLLGRTRRLRVGTAVTLAHLYHPVQLAEQVALLDQASGGRLDFGIGRGGYLKEVEVFGVSEERHQRAIELTLDVVLPAWADEEIVGPPDLPFPAARVRPLPRTRPRPPLFLATMTEATIERAAREGLPLLLYWAQSDEQRVALLARYRAAAERQGSDPDAIEHVVTALAYVADSDAEADGAIRANLNSAFTAGDQPGVASLARRADVPRDGAAALTDRVLAAAAIGTPERCRERLQATIDATGGTRLVLMVEMGGGEARTREQVARLAAEVIPHLRMRQS